MSASPSGADNAPAGRRSKLDAALAWAERGFRVFPLQENGKLPAFATDWRALATMDRERIVEWWRDPLTGIERGYNIGVATGAGAIVIDLDVKAGADGPASWQEIGGTLGTLTVDTPSGGKHLYFSNDLPVSNSASRLAPGVDVRGDGGYVVAPGSMIDGREYRLTRDTPPSRLPDAIAAKLAAPVEHRSERLPAVDELDRPDAIAAARGYLRSAEPAIQGSGGDHRTYQVACEVRDRGVSAPMALDLMLEDWNERCEPPWDPSELRTKIDNAFQYAQRAEGEKHPAASFQGVQIIELPRPILHMVESRLRFLSPDECAATVPRPYVVKAMIAAGQIGCVFGAPGAGKSVLVPHLAYAVAQGRKVFGRRTRQGVVIYAAAEDQSGMRSRVRALRQRHSLADQFRLLENIGDLTQEAHVQALVAAILERSPVLIVLDTLAATFPGIDENSSADMSRVVATLHRLATTGAAVVALHHDPKSGDSTPRGHSVLNGALDVAVHVTRQEDGTVLGKMTKNRNGPIDAPIGFRIDSEFLEFDQDGDRVTAPIAREIDAATLRRRVKLAGAPAAALEMLTEMAAAAPEGWVAETDWRKACADSDDISASDVANTRRQAVKRAIDKLRSNDLIELNNGMVRPVRRDIPEAATIQEVFAGAVTDAAE